MGKRFDRRLQSFVLVFAALAGCSFALFTTPNVTVAQEAKVETVTSFVMPDGTIFDVPNNYTYEWFQQGVSHRTDTMYLLLKLPELQPQNLKTWKGLHWGIGKDADALRILVHWKDDIRAHFATLEKIEMDEVASLKDYATQVPDPDHTLHYSFHWSTPRNNATPRPKDRQTFDEVYFKKSERGLTRYMWCGPEVPRRNPHCEMTFIYDIFEIRASFPRRHFANWKTYETSIRDMLDRFKRKR